MIFTFLTAASAFLKRVPWPVYAVLGALLASILWGNHRYSQGVVDTEAKYAAIAAQALTKAREADARAQATVERDKALSGAEIERGRKAAAGSDDPWKAAADSMRKPK